MQYKIISDAERNILGTTVKLLLTTLARFFFHLCFKCLSENEIGCNLVFYPKKGTIEAFSYATYNENFLFWITRSY